MRSSNELVMECSKPVGLKVHLIPGETHHPYQKHLQQTMAAHQLQRRQAALLGEGNAVHAGSLDEV